MNICHEFSRCAHIYHEYSSIQKAVAKELLAFSRDTPKNIVDLGCGDGLLYSQIDWEIESFVGVDFSQTMLECHPKSPKVELREGDFNSLELFASLKEKRYDRIYSSSALQWADDLSLTLRQLSQLRAPLSLAIFTSGTFRTLHEYAHIPPLLKSSQELLDMTLPLFDARTKILNYTLEFNTVREMFGYIKRSGVSGGKKMLTITQVRKLMSEYPDPFVLEFEILLLSTN
jgi:malonyl-CoA O-methyltransferase